MNDHERDYLAEARAILDGTSRLLPELAHLEALQEAHECQLITIAQYVEALKLRILGI